MEGTFKTTHASNAMFFFLLLSVVIYNLYLICVHLSHLL